MVTNIGIGHLKKVYHGRRLTRVLYGAKKAKAIKTMDYFNENVFKTFWEAEGGKFFYQQSIHYGFTNMLKLLKKILTLKLQRLCKEINW